MEQYEMSVKLPRTIQFGVFEKATYNRHEKEYGKDSAEKILKTCVGILRNGLNQLDDTTKNNNVLLVGKVQSGKTSNLEMITSLAFDNGFNLMVIYGGYDSTLLRQCVERFSDCFSEHDDDICILSTDNNDFDLFDENFFKSRIDENIPIIIVSMKRPNALEKVNECLSKISYLPLKPFIIAIFTLLN